MNWIKISAATVIILITYFFLSVFCILSVPLQSFMGFSDVYAEGNLHIGTLEIHPFASIEQKYDDNIFLEENNNENNDWITTTTFGFGCQMPIVAEREDDFLLEGEYAVDIIEFWDESGQSRIDHAIEASADFLFANDFTLEIKEDFNKTADPATSELTALEKRSKNIVEVVVGFLREKIGLDFGYKNIRDGYNDLNSLDKHEHVITTTADYQVFPKTSVFGEYNYGQVVYDVDTTNSDSKYHQMRLGVKGDIGPKLAGLIKLGYKTTSYDDSSKDDFRGFTVFGNITYDLHERSKLDIYGERSSIESTYRTNSYFVSNKIGLELEHQLRGRLFLVTGGFYQFNKYPDDTTESSLTAKRKDNIWDCIIGLRYEAKEWLRLESGYEYKQRDSEFNTFDYKDNKFTTKVSVTF